MARPWACPSRTGSHPGPHAGVSRPCWQHRMRADCRAHAPTLATAPGPALQPIGHPHRDLRPGQVHQRASGPACHADRGAAAPSHPIRAGGVATGLRRRYASGMPQCPDRGCHRLEMRSRRRSPAASPSRAAVIASAAATLSGFSRARRNIPSSVRRESRPADDLICSVRAAPLLPGRPGPATGLASLKDMRLRVSGMPDDLPQVTELDLSPVIARPDSAVAADARIRIQPAQPADAYPRRLR